MSRASILVVDDSPENLHVVGGLLSADHQVRVATSGARALELVQQAPRPDLIILDIMMPVLDGYGVLQALRRDPQTRDIPVIFLSALDEVGDEERGLALGAVDYVTKPVQPAILLRRVKTHLELRRHSIELEQRVAERTAELEKARVAAEAAHRAKALFLANMSHELRTPMNGILGLLELVSDQVTEPDARSLLDLAQGCASTLHALLSDVLEFASLDEGASGGEVKVFELKSLVSSIGALFRPRAHEKHLGWVLDVDPRVPPQLRADLPRLRQVLLKLVDNAFKFTATGGVTLSANVEGSTLRFEIRDTGIGLSPEQASHLFEPFTQLDASSTRQFDGAGLGLAIARRHAEAMRGRLGYAPAPGGGTLFWLEVPFALP